MLNKPLLLEPALSHRLSTLIWRFNYQLFAPRFIVFGISFLCFAVLVFSYHFLTNQPFFDLNLTPKNGAIFYSQGNQTYQIKGLLHNHVFIPINSDHLKPDPDHFRTFDELNRFLKDQQSLFEALHTQSLQLINHKDQIISIDQVPREIKDIPLTFWSGQLTGWAAWLIGILIWCYHRNKLVTLLIMLGGFGFYINQVAMAIHASREIALQGELFKYLLHANHLGGSIFAWSTILILWFYPTGLCREKFALYFYILPLSVWLNEILQWIEWPFNLFYFHCFPLLALTILVVWRQYLASRLDTSLMPQYRWLLLTIISGLGLVFIYYVIPIVLGQPPMMNVWIASFICLMIYLSFVLGVYVNELFHLEQWWMKTWRPLLFNLSFMTLDFCVIAIIILEILSPINTYTFFAFWIYISLRQRLKSQIKHWLNPSRPIDQYLFGANNNIQTLNSLFHPIALHPIHTELKDPVILDGGLKLHCSIPLTNGQFQNLELVGKHQGDLLFSPTDVGVVQQLIFHLGQIQNLHQLKDDSLKNERDRIMRDLHDDVAADLLSLVQQSQNQQFHTTAKKCLLNLREIVYSMDDQENRCLIECIADWRYELSAYLEPFQVKLTWNNYINESVPITGSQWLHLTRVLRELVANALKHAQPSQITIDSSTSRTMLTITITNNGSCSPTHTWKPGKGLNNIQRRITSLKGEAVWHAEKDQCKVQITLPLSISSS